ncbi:hypothetical protein C7B61_14155 [filamentous cyanobacterium CCP1]|nr:hypothetical protein C7B61_14155 [filamentous cyanobacterium CCP1]
MDAALPLKQCGCIPLLHFYDKSLTGRQDACATEIDPFASMGCSQNCRFLTKVIASVIAFYICIQAGSKIVCSTEGMKGYR